MKHLAFILTLICFGCTTLTDTYYWRSFPGAMKDGQCAPYAKAVDNDLKRRGVESYYLEFNWRFQNVTGRHSCVSFQKSNVWYMVDNETCRPMIVKSNSFIEMVNQWKSLPMVEIMDVTNGVYATK